jgi:hypothetical protein
MGEIAERYRRSAIKLSSRFPKAYARVSRKAWKALSELMENERTATSGPATLIVRAAGSQARRVANR